MAYIKRDWNNTGNEVTKEDFIRIENGVEANDLEIANQKNATIPGTLANKLNVLNEGRGYLDTVILPNNTDFDTLLENGKYAVNTSINSPITNNQWTYNVDVINHKNTSGAIIRCVQTATLINTSYKTYRRVLNGGVWTTWDEITTATKTSFSCTANTGFAIESQDCYNMCGITFINVVVKKIDGTPFSAGEIRPFTSPYGSNFTAGSVYQNTSSTGSIMAILVSKECRLYIQTGSTATSIRTAFVLGV